MIYRKLLVVFCTLLMITSCTNNPLDISTEGVSLSIRHTNIDSILNHTDTTLLLGILMEQRVRTPDIVDYELGYCLRVGSVMDPKLTHSLVQFKNDPYVIRLEKRIQEKFTDLPARTTTMIEAFKHLKVHLPKAKLPSEIVYMNSYFASSAFCTDQEIAIGLERYLGAKTDVIAELPEQEFFPWIKEKMDAQYLERDAIAAWIMSNMVSQKENPNNISAIIHWGKIIYLTEAAFPDKPKNWIMRYSEKDYNWALKNERSFWDYLVKEKLLFDSSERTQANLLNDAPFTTGLPEKGPDRLGQFLGWRIIQSYMSQHDISVEELMNLPYTEILQEYELAE